MKVNCLNSVAVRLYRLYEILDWTILAQEGNPFSLSVCAPLGLFPHVILHLTFKPNRNLWKVPYTKY